METTIIENSVKDSILVGTIEKYGSFEFDKKEFLESLKMAFAIVPKKSTMPIIRNIKIVGFTTTNEIVIYSTDSSNELTIFSKIGTNIQNFEILIDAEKMIKVLSKIDNGNYKLQVYKNTVEISGIDCKFEFNRIVSDEYPIFENFNSVNADFSFLLKSEDLLRALNQTVFAIRDEPSRYQMNGILLQSEINLEGNTSLHVVATDTKRLSFAKIDNFNFTAKVLNDKELNNDLKVSCIIDPVLVKFLLKFLDKGKILTCKIFGQRIFIDNEIFCINSRLVNGIFPDFKRAIPISEYSITLNRIDLIKSIEKVLPFVNDITKSIQVNISEKLELVSELPESGKAEFSVKILSRVGGSDTFEAKFNPKFIIEGLKAMDCKLVDLRFKDNKRPLIIVGCDETGTEINNFLYLIMPVLARE